MLLSSLLSNPHSIHSFCFLFWQTIWTLFLWWPVTQIYQHVLFPCVCTISSCISHLVSGFTFLLIDVCPLIFLLVKSMSGKLYLRYTGKYFYFASLTTNNWAILAITSFSCCTWKIRLSVFWHLLLPMQLLLSIGRHLITGNMLAASLDITSFSWHLRCSHSWCNVI